MTTHAPDPTPSMQLAALWFARQAIPVFPLWWPVDGRCACPAGHECASPAKHPLTPNGLHDATDDETRVKAWWTKWPSANIGLPTGTVFDVIDIDGAAATWAGFTARHGTPEHRAIVITGRGAGGFHLYCFPGGRKTIPSGKRGLPPGIEVKGAGGYVVAPPSLHVSGINYRYAASIEDGVIHGDTPWHDWYNAVTYQPPRETATFTAPAIAATAERSERYGAAVLRKAADAVTGAGEGGRWNALALEAVPLAARAVAGGCVDRQHAIATLQQAAIQAGLDRSEAARIPQLFDRIERQGIREPIAPGPDTDTAIGEWLNSLPRADTPPAYIEELAQEDARRTTWWPLDLAAILDGDETEPPPQHLHRLDGTALFYAGKVNGLIGESESGKTWIALLAVTQALTAGQNVLYLDFEDTPKGIINRLKAMATTNSGFAQLSYIGPDETLNATAASDLAEHLREHKPDLIILDGFNAAMTLLGLELTDNTDATKFSQLLLKPLARTGACVIYVDHVPKNKDQRGKGGIGAQAKRAMTTGCAIAVHVVDPFGRGMTGRLRLTVDKDRPGHVRAASIAATAAGEAILISKPDGSITVDIQPAMTADLIKQAKEAADRRRIVAAVESFGPAGASRRDIADATAASQNTNRPIIEELVRQRILVEDRSKTRGGSPTLHVNPDPDQEMWDFA